MLNLRHCRYGHLTPLDPTDARDGGSVIWLCECDCGNFVFVSVRYLKLGYITCCESCAEKAEKNRKKTVKRPGRINRTR